MASFPNPLSPEFVEKIQLLEVELDKEVWLLIEGPLRIGFPLYNLFLKHKQELPKEEIALVIDSSGGNAEVAYRLSMMLRRQCGGFTAIVPRCAKSAATLLALGAQSIILADDAELGPLDAQFPDYDGEEQMVSALDTVQAVEQLEDSAVEVAMKMLRHLHNTTRKKYNILLEHALHFAAEITSPLFEKINSVSYTRQSRVLREAQDYAERLLQPRFSLEAAKAIASYLVTQYPTHDFVINREEAATIGRVVDEETREPKTVGLHVIEPPSQKIADLLFWLRQNENLSGLTAIGRLEKP